MQYAIELYFDKEIEHNRQNAEPTGALHPQVCKVP